jgi:hypothetical protein
MEWNIKLLDDKKIKFSLILCLIIGSILYLYFLQQVESKFILYCPFHLLTGLYCPGCGSLRGLHSILNGNFLAALHYNALMVFSLPFIVYSFIIYSYKEISGKELKRIFVKPVFIWLLLVLVLLFWIIRNIPVYPFTVLAPGG